MVGSHAPGGCLMVSWNDASSQYHPPRFRIKSVSWNHVVISCASSPLCCRRHASPTPILWSRRRVRRIFPEPLSFLPLESPVNPSEPHSVLPKPRGGGAARSGSGRGPSGSGPARGGSVTKLASAPDIPHMYTYTYACLRVRVCLCFVHLGIVHRVYGCS